MLLLTKLTAQNRPMHSVDINYGNIIKKTKFSYFQILGAHALNG